jgi:GDP-L-fucose synthase
MIDQNSKIYIAGHNGMVGSACVRLFQSKGFNNLIFKTSKDLDLRNQKDVVSFFEEQKPDAVIIAAAKVGGIYANDSYGYDFLMDNLQIQNNLISASERYNVEKVIFLGSSCIYPKMALQPLKEEYLLSGSLEETNQWYAIAKIAGVKSIEALNKYKNKNYVSLMPTNLYGQNDNYDPENAHVLPALLNKFHEGKLQNLEYVNVWGSGNPLREFLHVDDLAYAIFIALNNEMPDSLYNVGSGKEISIKNLAVLIKNIVGFKGDIKFDSSKPDGTPRKLMNSSKFRELTGWTDKISLNDGIEKTYKNIFIGKG